MQVRGEENEIPECLVRVFVPSRFWVCNLFDFSLARGVIHFVVTAVTGRIISVAVSRDEYDNF